MRVIHRKDLHGLSSGVPSVPNLPLRRREHTRATVVALFREGEPSSIEALQSLSQQEWKDLLRWLDTSGLALYFLDRLREQGLVASLPIPVLRRLTRNLLDNTDRTAALVEECCGIQRQFAAAGVSYAVLKGFSLWPHSVPRLELRSQLDLDFLVAAGHESRAQAVLEKRGYRLSAVSGRAREFKTPYAGLLTLADLYKPSPQRTVEIHLEKEKTGLLNRSEHHALREVSMPVLPAADLFLDQALHLYKHLSRDQMRCSHMIELYRHLITRSADLEFWTQVKALCAAEPHVAASLGLVLDFVSQQMDPSCVPVRVRDWTIDRVPVAARVWAQRYSGRVTTAGFPGTKFHLLLQEAMAHEGAPTGRSIGASLIPRRLPPPIANPPAGETTAQASRRKLRQGRFILIRLRFHLFEGARYLWELRRWRRLLRAAAASFGEQSKEAAKRMVTGSVRTATKP